MERIVAAVSVFAVGADTIQLHFGKRAAVAIRKERFTIIARVMWKVFFWVGPIGLIFPETFRTFGKESYTKNWKVSKN